MGWDYQANDSTILDLTEAAAKKLIAEKTEGQIELGHSKICLNYCKKIEYNIYTGIDQLIYYIEHNISLCQPLNIYSEDIKEMQDLIKKINCLKKNWRPWQFWQFSLMGRDDKGLSIIFNLTKLATLNNQLLAALNQQFANNDLLAEAFNQQLAKATHPQKLLSVSIYYGCASGENRTSITNFNNIGEAVIDYFEKVSGKSFDNAAKKDIFYHIAKSQHTPITTGIQGGILGKEGIKEPSVNSLRREHPKKQLVTNYAGMKNFNINDLVGQSVFSQPVDTDNAQSQNYHNPSTTPPIPIIKL
jgi:hypothetical protein